MQSISRMRSRWGRFWLKLSLLPIIGRSARKLAAWGMPPFHGQVALANLIRHGFISPYANIHHGKLQLGNHVYIGDRTYLFQDIDGGGVRLGNRVCLIGNVSIQTGAGGCCEIGDGTCVQPFCQFSAYKSKIIIGSNVEIAPYCAFYPYDHGISLDAPINTQPLQSKGGIFVGDDAWLGVGVKVLDGVKIGNGAVVAAGAVVTRDLPDFSISAGVPASVVKMRT